MLKLKVGFVMRRDFDVELGKLLEQPLSGHLAYKLSKIAKKANEEANLGREAYRKVADKYGKKDDKEQLEVDAHGLVVPMDEHKELFAKEVAEVLAQEFTIEVPPISPFEITSLTKAQIAPITLLVLEPLFTPPPELSAS